MLDLQRLKKANKAYKLKLANKAGFTTVEDYLKSLQSSKKTKTYPDKGRPTINIVNIVDASGSMRGSKLQAANEMVVKDITMIKKSTDIDYTYTLISFSDLDDIIRHHFMVPAARATYVSLKARGMTALYQAVGDTLERLEQSVGKEDKTIVSIITDGEHNTGGGKYESSESVKELIDKLETKGFTITFIGTDEDVLKVTARLKLHASNTLGYDGSGTGLTQAFAVRGASLDTYSTKVLLKQDVKTEFFKKSVK